VSKQDFSRKKNGGLHSPQKNLPAPVQFLHAGSQFTHFPSPKSAYCDDVHWVLETHVEACNNSEFEHDKQFEDVGPKHVAHGLTHDLQVLLVGSPY
jgi:hypothetical protein